MYQAKTVKTHNNSLVVLAHIQLMPFYRLSTRDVTQVRKCTRSSPTLSYCKRREAGRGPGNEARRKANKYEDLVETGRRNGYDTSTVMLEVGSRGFLNPEGFKHLFSSLEKCSSKSRHHFLQDVSRKAILGSHRIWTLRNSLI